MTASVPQLVTAFVGGLLIVAFFVPPLEPVREEFSLFFDILAAFAFVLGGASLLGRHRRRIAERSGGWGWSGSSRSTRSRLPMFSVFMV